MEAVPPLPTRHCIWILWGPDVTDVVHVKDCEPPVEVVAKTRSVGVTVEPSTCACTATKLVGEVTEASALNMTTNMLARATEITADISGMFSYVAELVEVSIEEVAVATGIAPVANLMFVTAKSAIFVVVTAPSAIVVVVTVPAARSAEVIVPSTIFTDVIEPSASATVPTAPLDSFDPVTDASASFAVVTLASAIFVEVTAPSAMFVSVTAPLAKSTEVMVPSAIFTEVTEPSASFIIRIAPSETLLDVTVPLASLFVVMEPSLIFMVTIEPSARSTAVREPSSTFAEVTVLSDGVDVGKILGATEIIARVVTRDRIHETTMAGTIFLKPVDEVDNFLQARAFRWSSFSSLGLVCRQSLRNGWSHSWRDVNEKDPKSPSFENGLHCYWRQTNACFDTRNRRIVRSKQKPTNRLV